MEEREPSCTLGGKGDVTGEAPLDNSAEVPHKTENRVAV